MSTLEQLKQVLQPSGPGTLIDWDAIAVAYGTRFPTDYMEFMSTYGNGVIEDRLLIYAPSTDPEYIPRVSRLSADVLDLPEVNEWKDPRHADLYSPADILGWGETSEADVLAWITSSDEPDDWPVAVYTHGDEWSVYDCSMTEFLLKFLIGDFEHDPIELGGLYGEGRAQFTSRASA